MRTDAIQFLLAAFGIAVCIGGHHSEMGIVPVTGAFVIAALKPRSAP